MVTAGRPEYLINNSMTRFTAIIILSVFALWLLPLGVLVKPSQEKLFCGGQRAICLCSHMKAKAKASHAAEPVMTVTPSANKEAAGFSSSAFDVTALLRPAGSAGAVQYISSQHNFYNLSVSRPVEHVPKA